MSLKQFSTSSPALPGSSFPASESRQPVTAPEEEQDRILEVVVEDDGPGFGPEELRHATEPFYRGEGQMEQCHFGLGLYICRLICAKCGGSLALSNSVRGGRVTARFKIFSEKQKSR